MDSARVSDQTIGSWLILVFISVVFVADVYYTRKWLKNSRRELREIQRNAARALGRENKDDDDAGVDPL